LVAGFIAGGVLLAVPATGQIAALGWRGAWSTYHAAWLRFLLTASAAMAAAFVAVVLFDRFYAASLYAPHRGSAFFHNLRVAVGIVLVAITLAGTVAISYQKARNPGAKPFAMRTQSPQSDESSAVRLASDASRLIEELTSRAKEETLAASQLAVAANQLHAGKARDPIDESLVSELAHAKVVLERSRPITKQDLAEAQHTGWWQGILLGVLTSVIGSFVFTWLSALRGGSVQ